MRVRAAACSSASVVHHRRRDPRDHVGAERLLRVEDRAHRLRLAGLEVEQRRDDGRRAEVEGDRVAACRSCRPARRRSAGRRRARRSPSSRDARSVPPSVAHDLERDAQLDVVHRREHALEIRALVLERRLGRARGSASAPPAAGSRGGRRRRARPSAASAAAAPRPSRSSCACARHASRQPLFSSSARERARIDRRRSARARRRPCTLHFLQVPWPPQVESIATPFQLAASKSVVPASTRASLTARSSPDWRKRSRTRSGCGSSGRSTTRAHAAAAACFAR